MSLPQAALLSITPMIPPGGSLAAALKFYIGQDGGLAAVTLVENNDRARADNASFGTGDSDVDVLSEEYSCISARVARIPDDCVVWSLFSV